MNIKYLDLFSGIGGFREALRKTTKHNGIRSTCVGFSEIDENAIRTYRSNFEKYPEEKELGDISKITTLPEDSDIRNTDERERRKHIDKNIPDFDFLFAGFPCQPFSLMGNGKGFADTRGTLFFHIEKIINAKKPLFFILENVRRLHTHDQGKTYRKIIDILDRKLDYHTVTWLLNSSDYGIPQTRRRLYILGFNRKKIKVSLDSPPPTVDLKTTKTPTTWHVLDRDVDDRYFLSSKILKTILSNGTGGYNYKSEIDLPIARPLCATMHKMHRACQDNYFSEKYVHGKYDSDKNRIILNNRKNGDVRRLTPKEAFRLQGFEDRFVERAYRAGVADTQLYRQAGNAVTVNTVQNILEYIFEKTEILSKI